MAHHNWLIYLRRRNSITRLLTDFSALAVADLIRANTAPLCHHRAPNEYRHTTGGTVPAMVSRSHSAKQ